MNRRLFIQSISLALTFFIFGVIILSIEGDIIFFETFPIPFLKQALVAFAAFMFLVFTASLFEQRIITKFEDWHERPPNSTLGRTWWSIFLGIFWLAWTLEFLVGCLEGASKIAVDYQWIIRITGMAWYLTIVLALIIKQNRHTWNMYGWFTNILLRTKTWISRMRCFLLDKKLYLYRAYSWGVRLLVFIACLVLSWFVYSSLVLSRFNISGLQGQDILAIIGVSFGIYATTQVILRYYSIPIPKIIILNTQPKMLGPTTELVMTPDASNEQKGVIQHLNRLRQFAVHHLQVWSFDIPWYFRPLIQKIAIGGCHIRFRYTRIDNHDETLLLNGDWLYGRWNDNPEPITKGGFELGIAITNRRLSKLFATEEQNDIDAYPFTVAFVMKKQGMNEFYHFNDESYQYNDWCNPNWLFGLGTYRVDVRLTGYGLLQPVTKTFKLINRGININDLLLNDWK